MSDPAAFALAGAEEQEGVRASAGRRRIGRLRDGVKTTGGEVSGAADPFDGLIDEVRISSAVSSDALLTASWRNLSTPASFLSSGAEGTEGGGATPTPRRPIVITVAT